MKSKFLIGVLVACLMLGMGGIAYAESLTDISGHWAQTQIDKMITKGVVKGYPDGSFKPEKLVSRAEFCAMVNQAFAKLDPSAKAEFSDVEASAWYYQQAASGKKAGYISGYPDGTFQPDKLITRAEAASALATILKLDTSETDASMFNDASKMENWSKGSVIAVSEAKVMAGYPDGSFKPTNPISRAEAVVAIDNALSVGTKDDVVPPVSSGGGSSGGGSPGGSEEPSNSLPAEVQALTTMTDPFGDTLVKVIIKANAIDSVKGVKVREQSATKVIGNTNEWRITLDDVQAISNSEIKVVKVSLNSIADPFKATMFAGEMSNGTAQNGAKV